MRQELTLRGNHALLTRANPLAKFTAVMLITMVLALSIDWVSASVALAFELALLPLAGLTLGLLWRRGWPLILAGSLKIVYAVLLLAVCRKMPPVEESSAPGAIRRRDP